MKQHYVNSVVLILLPKKKIFLHYTQHSFIIYHK